LSTSLTANSSQQAEQEPQERDWRSVSKLRGKAMRPPGKGSRILASVSAFSFRIIQGSLGFFQGHFGRPTIADQK
jgi:hypothetical protein